MKAFEERHFTQLVNIIDPDCFPVSFAMHWHKHIELIAILDSAKNKQPARIRVNQIEYNVEPGDLIFVWPGELHEILQTEKGTIVGIQFQANVLNEISDFASCVNFFRRFRHIRHNELVELSQKLQHHISEILVVHHDAQPFRNVQILINMYKIFMDLGLHIKKTMFQKMGISDSENGYSLEKMSTACNYIIRNCVHPIGLQTVANYAGLSTCYFSRLFKQTMGCSFVEYLTQQRVKHAQILLADSKLTVTEISYQSGLRSISTFNRVFRQCRGCSPSEYRRYYIM